MSETCDNNNKTTISPIQKRKLIRFSAKVIRYFTCELLMQCRGRFVDRIAATNCVKHLTRTRFVSCVVLYFAVVLLKDRIYQLRNRYNLEKRKVESLRLDGVNDAKSSWPLFGYLTFLDGHIRPRKSYKSMMRRSMHDVKGVSIIGSGHHGGGGGGILGGLGMSGSSSGGVPHYHHHQGGGGGGGIGGGGGSNNHHHHHHHSSIGVGINHHHHNNSNSNDFMSQQHLLHGMEIKHERGDGGDGGSDVPEMYACDFENK